ncbi:5-hydroxytryptamine receptor 1D [Hippoglossus stenolepis]|uniref:5-hydroxytryptamine receptor 1D n=1 Tax=Hippoglossus stenolepis TaxID=195615 RepID=UPI001FAFA84F|nr:5-hydroxytryptamine receptor 1D [Hippoglossus stenolepis]
MEELGGSWSEPRSPLQAAAGNGSWSGAAGLVVSGRTQLLLEILMVLMCLGAVTGNILVIAIVASTKTFHSVASVLIMNLAISDLLVGVGVMPFVALSIMNHGWVDFSHLCMYVGYTSSVYCTASVLTLAAIALDRYHSIMDCLRYSSRCTLWRTGAVVLWIWLQALATSCPPLLGWSSVSYMVPMYSCAVNWASSPSYTAFMAGLSYLVPAVVILFCYVNIVKVARSHARRIHTLEDAVQRSRNQTSAFAPGVSPQLHQCGTLHNPSSLIYHVSGQFVPDVTREDGSNISPALPNSAAEQSNSLSRRLVSILAPSSSQPPPENSQQHHNQHGVVRLFLVISAFFFCWTPYVGVALVQATETAISGQSSLVPPSAVTFSYWLVLLNSDINPLLYALLSKRFQGALQGLRQKIRARLGSVVGKAGEVRAEGDDYRSSEPCSLNTIPISPPSSTESSTCDISKYSPSILPVSTDLKHLPDELLCKVCRTENNSSSPDRGGDRRVDRLQVPARPQEGKRLPFSALTRERQATFLYGQITVRVEHDVC